MGPALLLTPLSPAVGPEGRLSPGVSPQGRLAAMSPGARAGAGSFRDRVWSEDLSLAVRQSETGDCNLLSQAVPHMPGSTAKPRQPTLPSGLSDDVAGAVSTVRLPLQPFRAFAFPIPTPLRFFTAASTSSVFIFPIGRRLFRRSFPLSMSGWCVAGPSRAIAQPAIYPLSGQLPVDKSG